MGYFEIRDKSDAAPGRSSRSKKPIENTIVVHFYGPDGTIDLSPSPTGVTIKVGAGDSAQVVRLTPQAQGGFASAPGHYPTAFRGTLNANLGGESLETNFMIQ
jgi:hypothetical protein